MFAVFKNNTARNIVVLLAGVMSVSYAGYLYYGLGADLDFAFYMLPMRAWELLAGSMAAIFVIYKGRLVFFGGGGTAF